MTLNGGDYIVHFLETNGFEHFFANPGSEFASIIQAFIEQSHFKLRPILVPHETVGVHVAHGAYLAQNKPQAIMFHSNIGLANGLAGIINASRANIPLLLISGATPFSEKGFVTSRDRFVHWGQDSFDQGAPLREYVKWSYEVRHESQLHDIFSRAFQIMLSPPFGPVHIQIPREILYNQFEYSGDFSAFPPLSRSSVNPQDLNHFERLLSSAKLPLILTNTLGENPTAIHELESFSLKHAVPVICPENQYFNFSTQHPHFCGFSREKLFRDSDLVINLGMSVPWMPAVSKPSPATKVVHVGEDPLCETWPLRSHPGELFIRSDLQLFLQSALTLEVSKHFENRSANIVRARNEWLNSKPQSPLDEALNQALQQGATLFNEVSYSAQGLDLDRPKSYFRLGPASCLGWSMAAAAGFALSLPQSHVMAVLGDGSYYCANSPVIHWLAQKHNLSLTTIVLNNGQMKSVAKTIDQFFPERNSQNFSPLPFTDLSPQINFGLIAEAFQGNSFCLQNLKELPELFESRLFDGRQNLIDLMM